MVLGSLFPSTTVNEEKAQSQNMLRWAALFLGELRDGLTMINMQNAFLIVSKNYSEKQAGILFFVFGMSQFLFQTPAGYLYDYTKHKIWCLSAAAITTTVLTILTALFATDAGGNLTLMVSIKFIQGAVTSFIPPGLNSITQGIVGAAGMTGQVATNEMMNHLGTAVIVLAGSLLGVYMYPELAWLFVVSPIACTGVVVALMRIRPTDIDHAAARGLTEGAEEDSYKPAPDGKMEEGTNTTAKGTTKRTVDNSWPSFNFGWGAKQAQKDGAATTTTDKTAQVAKADSPLKVLSDSVLLLFLAIVFLFHLANATVLPLVMQTLAIGSGREGILLSGLCVIVAQCTMVISAKLCGDYSGIYGRKPIFLIGLFTVPVRCLLLSILLLHHRRAGHGEVLPFWLQCLILSTQLLDGVGAGVFGTMYILVTSDISRGTGRFSMTLGLTTAAVSIGSTVSGYLGEALAEDKGYEQAFFILLFMALVPAGLYLWLMPETLLPTTKQLPQDKTVEVDVTTTGDYCIVEEEEEGKPEKGAKTETGAAATAKTGDAGGYSELAP